MTSNGIPTLKITIEATPLSGDLHLLEGLIENRLQRIFEFWKTQEIANLVHMNIEWEEGNEQL